VGACLAEYQVLEDSPRTFLDGGPLHRDFQLLSVMAEEADRLSQEAYRLYTGREPDLYHALYDSDAFRWEGYDPTADKLFKTERLRHLCVSSRRAKELCTAALASRIAKQRIAEGIAIEAAKTSELLYFANYDDHYTTGRDGSALREKLEAMRDHFLTDCRGVEPSQPAPEAVRKAVKRRVVINWERQTDVLPKTSTADKPGLYLSTDLGLSHPVDFFCVGAVFTVQARSEDGRWQTLFRKALLKKDAGWQHWNILLDDVVSTNGRLSLRLVTDAYSRAIDRNAPTWKWGYWGAPQLVEILPDGSRNVRYDILANVGNARAFVRLDSTGEERPFDGRGEDSTGAEFRCALTVRNPVAQGAAPPSPAERAIAAFAPHRNGVSGVTVGEFRLTLR